MSVYSRNLETTARADVVVVGGGPSGIAASVAAARLGAETILVERYGFLGGAATAALVGPFMTSFNRSGTQQIVLGVFNELVKRLVSEGGAIHPAQIEPGTPESGFHWIGHNHVTPFDSECLKHVASEFCIEHGVKLRLHTLVVDAFKESSVQNESLTLVCAGKQGLEAVSGKTVVDCTGDADVAFRLGLPVEKGRHGDGAMQPATMFVRIRNVDSDVLTAYIMQHYPPDPSGVSAHTFHDVVTKAREDGTYSIPKGHLTFFKCLPADEWKLNITRIPHVDGTVTADLTNAEVEGRRQARELVKFIRGNVPGCQNAIMVDTGVQAGYRETRRIQGQYCLTEDDVINCTQFDDPIAVYAYPMDLHNPAGRDVKFTETKGEFYQLPYRCLLPQGDERLLVAGRCISCTHEAMAAIRVMPCCFATGEAAGTAAGLSSRLGVTPSQLDYAVLRKQLLEQGAYLG